MPTPTSNSGLRDNHTRGTVADFLKGEIRDGSRLSVVSAYFTIYAYDALKDCLDRIDHLDFLFGEPSFVNRLDPSKTEKKAFIIDADGLELANKLQQKRVAKACADWIERKVDIKTIKQSNLLHGKTYYVATAGVEDAILGSSNFTVRGLGLGNGNNNIELNLIVDGNRDRQELKQWFDELWSNPNLVKDVKQEVLQYLKQLYENNAPEFIYYKTLFHFPQRSRRRPLRPDAGRNPPRGSVRAVVRPPRRIRTRLALLRIEAAPPPAVAPAEEPRSPATSAAVIHWRLHNL